MKLFHDKYNQKIHFAHHQAYVEEFEEAMAYNEQIKPHVNKASAMLTLALLSKCQL